MSKKINICSEKCFGVDKYHGSCCKIEHRDYIMGPILDPEEFKKNLEEKVGRDLDSSDFLIYFEEGKKMFPGKSTWQNPANYPAMRVDLEASNKHCIFYNDSIRCCTVYDIRPSICRDYFCDYLKNSLTPKPKGPDSNVTETPNFEV